MAGLAIEVGKGLAIDAAMGLAKLVIGRASDEMMLAWGFRDHIGKLKRKFEYVEALLEDLGNSKQKQESRLVDSWLKRVKDVAYLADNVMDDYAYELLLRKHQLNNHSLKVNIFRPANNLFFRFEMSFKVSEILSLFDELDKEAKVIGLSKVQIARHAVAYMTSNDNHAAWNQAREHAADAAGFVGRKDDVNKILQVICDPNNEVNHLFAVAIVGMGGLGKTTLARYIYSHQGIREQFGMNKMWINVSVNFNILRILNQMVESITSNKGDLSNADGIVRKLEEIFKGKKFLLVLDDVWAEDQMLWDSLKESLQRIGGLPGCVILVTTRNNEVASAARAVYKHNLKGLCEDESWDLLKQKASFSGTSNVSWLNNNVSRRIMAKCKGVPLVLKVMGGLLQSRQHLHEWKSIEESELWDLPQGYLWQSSKTRNNLTMEDIGEEFIHVLLNYSLLQECEIEGNVCYEMHDLVYDLAVHVSGDVLIKEVGNLSEMGNNCRHLVFNCNNNTSDVCAKQVIFKCRTITFVGNVVPWNLLFHARYLRTLFLSRTGITEIPSEIMVLKQLRYLDLSFNPISTLPDSIRKLYQLQTLILHECENMKKLPRVLNNLISLRHILTTMPMYAWNELRQLTNLQSLPSLVLNDKQGWTIDEVGGLQELRDMISILGLECVKDKEQAMKVRLNRKAKGRDIINANIHDEDVLDALQPHPNITSLNIENFNGEKFPLWIIKMAVPTDEHRGHWTQLYNLTVLKLLNCKKCQTLPTLGQLPLLKCLIISGLDVECIGDGFYGNDDLHTLPCDISFPSLIELEISGLEKLNTWIMPSIQTIVAVFPCLEILRVRDCPQLQVVPALDIKSLISLELHGLWNVKSLDILKYSTNLTLLILKKLPKVKSLPQELSNYVRLQRLKISGLVNLMSIPNGLGSVLSLQSMEVKYCHSLTFLPDDLLLSSLSSLSVLNIIDCMNLRRIPTSLKGCVFLKTLMILVCPLVEYSPDDFDKLCNLSRMEICCRSGDHLRSLLKELQRLPRLRELGIEGFNDEKEMTDYFSDMTHFLHFPSLSDLVLYGKPNIKSLPQKLSFLTQIKYLYFCWFPDLEEIPDWIHNLSSLEGLMLGYCNNLQSLPSKEVLQHLPQLSSLKIMNCNMLATRCDKTDGHLWHNISHISWISINGKVIQDLKRSSNTESLTHDENS